jgi:hypothetical protein
MPQDPLEIEVKRLDSIEIKGGDEEGHVEAVIATLNVVDRDHDVILPGAIKDGAHVTLSEYGHSTVIAGTPPVGKGTLQAKGNTVVFKGRYFMSTDRGKEAFRTIKEMGLEDQEWSFGFTVDGHEIPDAELQKKGAWRILSKLGSFEVSPVIRGAGIGTRTVSVKAAGASPPAEPPATEMLPENEEPKAEVPAAEVPADEPEPELKEDPAEVERKQAEIEAQRKLQAEIDTEVERFQRTQRLFNL